MDALPAAFKPIWSKQSDPSNPFGAFKPIWTKQSEFSAVFSIVSYKNGCVAAAKRESTCAKRPCSPHHMSASQPLMEMLRP
eukprot:1350216-Rhodomonas_salina.1